MTSEPAPSIATAAATAANTEHSDKCLSEIYLDTKDHKSYELFAVCRGIKDGDGNLIADYNIFPWSHKRTSYKPKVTLYRDEIDRRYLAYDAPPPPDDGSRSPRDPNKPYSKKWTVAQCEEWLDTHAISEPDDVTYLTTCVAALKLIAQAAFDATALEEQLLTRNWTGKYPYLRLMHCLVDFAPTLTAYNNRNRTFANRHELDDRRNAPPTCWEMMAIRFNTKLWTPTLLWTDIHPDYSSVQEQIPHSLVENMHPATAANCKDQFTTMATNLSRIISGWEQSGQGDGGIHPGENSDEDNDVAPAFGTFDTRSRSALDQRMMFLGSRPTYYLYLWFLIEENALIASTVHRINASMAGLNGADGVPSVNPNSSLTLSGRKKKREAINDDVNALSKSIVT